MEVRHLHDAELTELLAFPLVTDELSATGGSVVVVDVGGTGPDATGRARLASLPCIVVAVGRHPDDPPPDFADLVVEAPVESVDEVLGVVGRNPIAATALALLLRAGPARDVGAGLVAESAVYSMLQGGPEFARWHAGRARRDRPPPVGPAVQVRRVGDRLDVVLDRPEVRNAFSAQMRDELESALSVAAVDASVTEVVIRGNGPSFCGGGDLDEFGSFADPASAHLVRLSRSVGRTIHDLRDRVRCEIHGSCAGSGIELPAFAGTIVAAPTLAVSLPEVTMGLVPGAGGTVSLPARIGRHRTLLLALSGATVDAPTALAWGLVDAVTKG